MSRDSDLFNQILNQHNIYFNTWDEDDGDVYFQFNQKLDSGPTVKILAIFNSDDTLVSIYVLDYVTLVNTARKDYMYRLLNDINNKYTYYKFTMDDKNHIILSCFIPMDNNFKPEIILNLIFGSISVMDDEYPGFMKIIWS